jgi:hypothetical protein
MGKTKARITWRGDELVTHVTRKVTRAWNAIGQAIETEAKKELYPGHGVRTGDLRASVHADATILKNGRLTLRVGSTLSYALYIEIGGHNFNGYHYMEIGMARVTPRILDFVRQYVKEGE